MDNKLDKKPQHLNDKQRLFVQKMLVDNMAPREAYLAVYKVANKVIAGNNASRLLQNPLIKTEMASISNQLQHLAHTPKHRVMNELKEFLNQMKGDLTNPSNRKYYLQALDMLNKMMGYYQHNQTITKVNIEGSLDFGGWDPEGSSTNIEYITPEVEEVLLKELGPADRDHQGSHPLNQKEASQPIEITDENMSEHLPSNQKEASQPNAWDSDVWDPEAEDPADMPF